MVDLLICETVTEVVAISSTVEYDVPNVAKLKSEENFSVRKKTFRCGKTFFWSKLRIAL
jgi:hypothetical protein